MEPVKGGNLVNLPAEAKQQLNTHNPDASAASWAIRFASSLDKVEIVLSGMNSMEQIEDNMRSFSPLSISEQEILQQTAEIIRRNTAIPCTGCSYCTSHCPVGMPIPNLFSLYNDFSRNPDEGWKMHFSYDALANKHVPASACIRCKKCERNCPQKLKITAHLSKIVQAFEK